MTRRRATWLAVAWTAATAGVTVWVTSRTGGRVSAGDGLLAGALVATLLTIVLGRRS